LSQEHPRPRSNRRRDPRRGAKGSSRAACYTGRFGLGPNVAVRLLDVSEGGVRLVLRDPVLPGHEVVVGLDAPGERRAILITGVVVWCAALADGTHCVGIRLDKPLRWAALQALSRL
jgi:hypothetical protein